MDRGNKKITSQIHSIWFKSDIFQLGVARIVFGVLYTFRYFVLKRLSSYGIYFARSVNTSMSTTTWKVFKHEITPEFKKPTEITPFWNRPILFSQEKWPAACRRQRRAQPLSRIVRCCHCFCIQAIIWKGFERTKLTLESSLWLLAFCSVPCCRVEWNIRISRRGRECYDRSNSIQNTKGTFKTYAVNEVLIYFVMIICEQIL